MLSREPGDFEGIDLGSPAGFLGRAFSEGLNATQALQTWRDAGGAFRTQDWYALAGEVRAAAASALELQSVDKSLLPSDDLILRRGGATEGLYEYHFQMLTRDPHTREILTGNYTVRSNQLITPDAAESEALSVYGDHAAEYGEELLGSVWVGLSLRGA